MADDALGALGVGDTLAVVVVDGASRLVKSRNTPPATRTISVTPGGSA